MLDAPPREGEWGSWLYVALWTLLIFVTIPFARALQSGLAARWGREIFTVLTLGFLLAVAGVMAGRVARAAVGDRARRAAWLAGVFLAYFYYLWRLRYVPEEALHFVEYGVLGVLLYRALVHRVRNPLVFVAATLLGALVGTVDEILQWITPRRFWDIRDVWLNAFSVGLMQVALAFGLRPSVVSQRVGPASVRLVCRSGLALAVLLGVCLSNTTERMSRYTQRIPALSFLRRGDCVMTEYGYRHVDPEAGTFYSRFTLEQLRAEDAGRGAEVAAVLDRYRRPEQYEQFLAAYPPMVDAFAHEARVHLFRRDHYLSVLWKHAQDGTEGFHAAVAYYENRILEKYFSNTLAHSRYARLDASNRALLEAKRTLISYVSPVSQGVITRFREAQVWAGVLAIGVGLLALEWRFGREGGRRGP